MLMALMMTMMATIDAARTMMPEPYYSDADPGITVGAIVPSWKVGCTFNGNC